MVRFVLIRPGSTEFDEQGRIKGTLDIPLSPCGRTEVDKLVADLAAEKIDALYTAPCQCALETAQALAVARKLKTKTLPELHNLDHGLWHGKLIDELRQSQPKVYRQCQEHPEAVCPPEGESFAEALERATTLVERLTAKHRNKTVALVVPEPFMSVVRTALDDSEIGDLWKVECAPASWQTIEVGAAAVPPPGVRGA
jgi:broad specificity phosphatase PhoE